MAACGGDDDDDRSDDTTTTAADRPDDGTAADDEDGGSTTEPSEPDEGDEGDGEATEPSEPDDPSTDDPYETLPGAPPTSAPALPLTPSDPAWAAACEAATAVSAQAWGAASGGSPDPTALGASLLSLLDALPPGVAAEEAGYVRSLLTAYTAGEDVASFEDDFDDQVGGLVAAVDEGCGVGEGEVTVPPAVVDQLGGILFA